MAEFPYDKSSFISDLFYAWAFKVIFFYRKNPPTPETTFIIPNKLSVNNSIKILKAHWQTELKKPKPSFLKAIIKTIGSKYFIAVILQTYGQSQAIIQAVIINYLIEYLMDPSAPGYQGALLALALIFSIVSGIVMRSNASTRTLLLTGQLKALITVMISEKVLKINNNYAGEEKIRGKILNTISTDMELLELANFTVFMWCTPVIVTIAIIVLTYTFGAVGIVGIAISVLHIPLVILVGKFIQKNRAKANLIGDVRIKMIENLIEGIKIMKLYAWELPFLKFIFEKREEECKTRSKVANINGITLVTSIASVSLNIFITVLVQVSLGYSFTPGKVFLLLVVLINSHIIIVYTNTIAINTLFVFIGIMRRVGEILLIKEYSHDFDEESEKYSVRLTDITLSWREEDTDNDNGDTARTLKRSKSIYRECLQNISLGIQPGELVIVVGPVGSGKSSLLMGLLGELNLVSGNVSIQSVISYSSDEPWIISGSIKDNILMGRTLDPDFYSEVVSSCALMKDFEIFQSGDETIVGDRGATLSGGQKARVNLARAVYANSDIILLDDPLSAVDPEVANNIFTHCIRGILKGKTVILVTHQVQFISQADKILVLESGRNLFFGSYRKLKKLEEIKNIIGDFAFMKGKKAHKAKGKIKEKEEINEKIAFEEEEIAEGNVKWKIYWRFFIMGFKHPIWIILTLVALVLSQTLYQASIYWISYWSKQSDQKSSFYIEVMGVLVAMTYVAVFFRVYSLINGIFSSTLYLHNSALQSVALTNSEFYDKNPTGRIINRFSKDIGSTDGPLQLYIYESISTSAIIVSNIIVAIVIVPYNLIIIPIWVLIIGLLLKFVSPAIIQLRKIELTSRGPIISTMSSCLNGLPTIRCLNLQSKFLSDFEKYIDIHYRSYLTFQTFLRFNTAYCDLSSGLIAILNVIIIVGTKGLIQPSLAAYSLASCGGLMGITAMWSKNLLEVGSCMSTAQRLMEYADLEPEGEFECGEKFIIEKGDVKFDRIFMRYRLNLPFTLTGLSFHIRGGQKVGIIGRTGAGKSSVLQVLFRLVNPESGNIYLDGYDYMKLGLHDLRLQMSVIPQSAVLFSASIRDNLDPFHKYSDDEILQALEDVGLKNTILEYDEGLLVEVKNEVLSLSAGQKQLLCLARAILRKNKIIMMDEATANVDNETDRIMQETVKGKFEGCTMMIIAHRIRTIVESDRIIVMDKGMCVEFGKPKELFMEDNSLFRQMVMHTGPEESTFLAEKIENFEKKKMITKN